MRTFTASLIAVLALSHATLAQALTFSKVPGDPGGGGAVYSLVDRGGSGKLGLGTNVGFVITDDGGTTFTLRNNGLSAGMVAGLQYGGKLLIATGSNLTNGVAGLFATTDDGLNWASSNTGLPAGAMGSSLVTDGTHIYLLVNDLNCDPAPACRTNGIGVYKSTDGGASWTRKVSGLPNPELDSLAAQGSALYVVNNDAPLQVFKSTDGAETWTQASTGISGTLTSVNATPGALIAFNSSQVLYYSNNAGVQWNQGTGHAASADFIRMKAMAQTDSSGLVVYTAIDIKGVSYSGDGGASWTQDSTGLPRHSPEIVQEIRALLGQGSKLYAAVPGNEGGLFVSNAAAAGPDTNPNPFSFTDRTGVTADTLITSNAVTIQGIDAPAPVTVSGGEYSIGCGGTFTASAGAISANQMVCVRHLSSSQGGTTVNTTLTVGGASDIFSSTTAAAPADTTPDAFTFFDRTAVAASSVITSNSVSVTGINTAANISVTGGEYSVNSGTFTASAGTINNNDSLRVRHTSAASASTAINTTLSIGGISDIFTSTTAAESGTPDTTPDSFSFTDATGADPGVAVISNVITVAGIDAAAAISIAGGGAYSVNNATFTTAPGTVVNGDTVRVRQTSSSFGQTVSATLTIDAVSDIFSVTTRPSTANDEVPGTIAPGGSSGSVPNSSGQAVSLALSTGSLSSLARVPQPASAPSGFIFGQGFFAFDIAVASGGTSVVTLTLPTDARPTSYFKCPTGGGSCSAFAGASISVNVVTLTLTDGGAGDADGIANGVIRDPGAPAVVSAPVVVSGGGGAFGLEFSLLGLLAALRGFGGGWRSKRAPGSMHA